MLARSKQAGSSALKPSKAKAEPQASPPDDQEQNFWDTPGAAARTLHFTGELLTDEQIDMGELSASLDSPLLSARRTRGTKSGALQFTAREPDVSVEPEAIQHPDDADDGPEESFGSPGAEYDEDATVMLGKPLAETSSRRTQSPPEPPRVARPQDAASKRAKTKVTVELENIVVSNSCSRCTEKS